MAILQTPGDVKSVKFVDLPATAQIAAIWTVTLRSAADTIVVPGLESVSAVGSLKATTTVTAEAGQAGGTSAISPQSVSGYTDATPQIGSSIINIASGSAGDVFVFATLHRPGAINNLSIADAP